MTIDLLAEASTDSQYARREWGISFLINKTILFDTFSSADIPLQSLSALGVNPQNISKIIISHDHWDHTGGLAEILDLAPRADVILGNHFSEETKSIVKKSGNRLLLTDHESLLISEGVYSTGEIAGSYNNAPLYEQSIVLKGKHAPVLLTGCAHPDILLIIDTVIKKFNLTPDLVMGGFHLLDKSEEEVKTIIHNLNSRQIPQIAPCHCTGQKAVDFFRKHSEGKVLNPTTGFSYSFE